MMKGLQRIQNVSDRFSFNVNKFCLKSILIGTLKRTDMCTLCRLCLELKGVPESRNRNVFIYLKKRTIDIYLFVFNIIPNIHTFFFN